MFGLMNSPRSRGDGMLNPFQELEHMTNSIFGRAPKFGFDLDVKDLGGAFELKADLPGMKKEDLHVDLDGDYLTISAQRSEEHEEKDAAGNYIRRERSYGSFRRTFDVSSVDTEQISASYQDGVLSLRLPKKESAQSTARRLEIQ